MRWSLVAVPVTLLALAGAAAVSGAFSTGSGKQTGSAASAKTGAQMPMPMPKAAAAAGPARVELHRGVVRVAIRNFAFVPARLVVSPGTRITWTNGDSDPHTVTTDKSGFASQALDTGARFTVVVRRAGTFAYHCTIHPFMRASVVVKG